MAVVISNGNTTLNTASGFYRVESYNLGTGSSTNLALTTTRYQNITFANAGNCLGIVLDLTTVSMSTREVICSLEEYQSVTSFDTGTEKVNKVAHGLLDNDIVSFTTTGVLPTGITAGTQYYVRNKTANDFQLSSTPSGSIIALSGTPSGTWSVGVQRSTKTMTTSEIAGEGMSGTYKYRGGYFTPITFTSSYAVDTTASKWRFRITHGTGTGTWNLRTSDATNPFYATWCDNAVSFNNDDTLIVKDKVIIDKTCSMASVLGTGDTVYGIACIICSNVANPGIDDVALLEWENPPVSSYELTIKGLVVFESFSGIRIGTEDARIPIAQKAILSFGLPNVGTTTARFASASYASGSYDFGVLKSLFFYGEIPTYQKTSLVSNAVIGQAHLLTTNNVDWVNGDSVVIGKQNIQGQGVITIHTVSSVAGNDITLTSNLATNDRLAGATVIKLDCHGIKLRNTSTYSTNTFYSCANLIVDGVDINNISFSASASSYYYYLAYLQTQYYEQIRFQDICAWSTSNSNYYLTYLTIPPKGVLINRVYTHRVIPAYNPLAYYALGHISGRFEIKNGNYLSLYSGPAISATNTRITWENNTYENGIAAIAAHVNLSGVNHICKNNSFFGIATPLTSFGTMSINSCVSPTEISGNKFDNCLCAIAVGPLSVNAIDENCIFGSEVANTVDIGWAISGTLPNYTFKNPTGSLVFDETELTSMLPGGCLKFTDYNGAFTDDKVIYNFGKIQRTNSSLTDTTVRTAGGSALRFEPLTSTDEFVFSFDVPTGNIQNKVMTIAIWCKIASSDYYSGAVYTLPKLSISYDDGSVAYSQATNTTDWQFISVNISPITTTGKIIVSLSGTTDAVSPNNYFYWDDISVLYPAGYILNLGGMDIWDNALPVLPPISTLFSASDVWTVDTSSFTAPGTTGKTLVDIPTAAEIAAEILDIPANKLVTNVDGKVNVLNNDDKTGYEINGTKNTLDDLNDAPALIQRSEPPTVGQIRIELEGATTKISNINNLVTLNLDGKISEISLGPIDVPTLEEIWNYEERTLTSGGFPSMTQALVLDRPSTITVVDRMNRNIVSAMSHYMTDLFAIYKFTDYNTRNQPLFEEYNDVPCRFVSETSKVMDLDGNMVVSTSKIYASLNILVELPQDYIVYNNVKYNPIHIDVKRDVIDAHQEIYLR